MTLQLILYYLGKDLMYVAVVLTVIIFWAGCGSFWVKFINENQGIVLSIKQSVLIYLFAPLMLIIVIVYSMPYKLLNWATDLKKEE
jgi:hypothetical protein